MRRVANLPFCDFSLLKPCRTCIPDSKRGPVSLLQAIKTLMLNTRTLSFLFSLMTTVQGLAQTDTAFISASISRTRQLYTHIYKTEWPMNSGGQYVEYASIEGEHPYFISSWNSGSVLYLDDTYENISMLLDLRGDRLIIQHALFDAKIELSPEKVKAFTFGGHKFIHIRQDTLSTLPESGYYQVLQSGKVSLIARHQKTIQRSMALGKPVAILKKIDRYYLLKDGVAVPVDSRKSILHALQDQPDLKARIKKSKVKFGANREAGLAETVRIYNQLIKVQ